MGLRSHFAVLSLDLIDPVLPAMGLDLSDTAPLHAIARNVVRQADKVLEYQDDLVRQVEIRRVLEEALRELRGRLGRSPAESVIQLIARWPDPDETVSGFLWSSAIRSCVNGADPGLGLELSPDTTQHVRNLFSRYLGELDDELRRLDSFDPPPQSPWDHQIMAEDWLPLSWASGLVKWRMFERFASQLRSLLTPADVSRLTEVLRTQNKAYRKLVEPP